MKAIVMAGGEGTRLRPLTSNQPKPMVPIVGKPCMEHIIELLREHGFEDVIITVAFLPQAIRSYFGDGESLGVNISYSVEETPLGTAGSVRLATRRLDEPILVISGDALCDVDLGAMLATHRERGAAVTIGLKSVDNPLEFGIVVTDEDGRIERFLEKPSWGQVFSDTINTGIYILEPEVLTHIPDDHRFTELALHCWPPYPATTVFYDDDGATRAYQRGEFSTTAIAVTEAEGVVTVEIDAAAGGYPTQPVERTLSIVLHRQPVAPTSVVVTGPAGSRPHSLAHDPAAQTVTVAFTHPVAEATHVTLIFSPD